MQADIAALQEQMGNLGPVLQEVTPAEGDTIQMTNNGRNGTLVLYVPIALVNLTVLLPQESVASTLQLRRIYSSGIIANLLLKGEDGTIVDSNISNMDPKDFFSFSRIGPAHWARQTS